MDSFTVMQQAQARAVNAESVLHFMKTQTKNSILAAALFSILGLLAVSLMSGCGNDSNSEPAMSPEEYGQRAAEAMQAEMRRTIDRNYNAKAILTNLRIIASSGQQYLLEEDLDSVSYGPLEGDYFQPIEPVAGEDYTNLLIQKSGGVLRVDSDVGEIVYTY